MFQRGMKAAIVGCSNGVAKASEKIWIELKEIFNSMGIELEFSPYLYQKDTFFENGQSIYDISY